MPETGAVRMYIPMPQGVDGNVEITATFCFYCEVNPEDSLNYTRDGLEITFRPDTHKTQKPYRNEEGEQIIHTMPPSDSFFGAADFYNTEVISRRDAQKWERSEKRRVGNECGRTCRCRGWQ